MTNNQKMEDTSYGVVSNNGIALYNGDCLEVMDRLIEEGIKVDAIITDPPYGTTACKWDSVIPFDKMWERLNKLIKPNGAIVLFGSEPFSSALRMSNIRNYKYDWVWEKPNGSNPFIAQKQPLNNVENICVFYNKNVLYNPQMVETKTYKRKASNKVIETIGIPHDKDYRSNKRYPMRILKYNKPSQIGSNAERKLNKFHPTQKPVALMEYLIKTYTNENELVLDFTAGSFSTGVACQNTNRNFIGIELDESYFKIGKERINKNNNKQGE